MRYIIGIDIGGTNIKAVLMNDKKEAVDKIIRKTDKKNIEDKIKEFIEEILQKNKIHKKDVKGVGVGFPGSIDKKRERIEKLPNIKGFKNKEIKKHLSKKSGLKIKIENDANCAALAESVLGAGKKHEKVVGLSIGTGIGGGIIINNKLFLGEGNAGEFGHLTIEEKGRKCSCGNKGCLEEYVSKKGIKQNAKSIGLNKDLYELYELAKKRDKKALKIFRDSGVYLGKGLSEIIKILDPEIIIVNGGIANSGEFIFPYAKKEMKKRVFFKTSCKIKKGQFKDFAGAIGACCLWF